MLNQIAVQLEQNLFEVQIEFAFRVCQIEIKHTRVNAKKGRNIHLFVSALIYSPINLDYFCISDTAYNLDKRHPVNQLRNIHILPYSFKLCLSVTYIE